MARPTASLTVPAMSACRIVVLLTKWCDNLREAPP